MSCSQACIYKLVSTSVFKTLVVNSLVTSVVKLNILMIVSLRKYLVFESEYKCEDWISQICKYKLVRPS